jgi:hypothetical protein
MPVVRIDSTSQQGGFENTLSTLCGTPTIRVRTDMADQCFTVEVHTFEDGRIAVRVLDEASRLVHQYAPPRLEKGTVVAV